MLEPLALDQWACTSATAEWANQPDGSLRARRLHGFDDSESRVPPKVAGLSLDRLNLSRRVVFGEDRGNEAAGAADRLKHTRLATADRSQAIQDSGRQLRRRLEIAEVASHLCPPAAGELAGAAT